MKLKYGWQPRVRSMFVVAPASPYTWAVAFSRRLIPGAVFSTQAAAFVYALTLAHAAGLGAGNIKILGTA